ncbi:dihydrolipoyl dehydrogenase family protein [Parachryseolinea silvisoli]|uniref:dihydrolipoyl dehydrogenase family protein n=1 Tax=Parachryseolinea silvisoli TaxID=2873601 RepID=UPI002265A7D3|nr:NAD(P)/FAD-dependent oxidoreductase [Parachryseolinea silvisoli]MCD9014032.1 NAD(P)/FAD-dependent oxidoreductase [Parachryseolinea silvisoli]
MEKYDLVVIGAGPSGYAAAMRALDFKKKVLLIEKNNVGGAGVTNGALSSKTWWELSRETASFRKNLRRFNLEAPSINYKETQAEVVRAVGERMGMLEEHLHLIQDSHYAGLLSFKKGVARLLSQNEVEISHALFGHEVVWTDNIILATGSRPRYLPELPIDEKYVMTSEGVEAMDDFPESMVIVGAGVIGCEYATIFSGFGQTKVHLIDKGDRILPFEDEDVVRVIERNMENSGVLIHRNSRLIRMEVKHERVEYELEYDDGSKAVFNVAKALVAVGRVPNYEDLWEDSVNITISKRGIEDNDTQTNISNIYAVGDITADISLVNVGELEGRYAVEKIFGSPDRKLLYENISTIMFLNPEVAGVGLNETQARERDIDYRVATLDYSCIPRAIAKRNTQGFIKLLVTNDEHMKILGMKVIGNQASSAIQAVALLISMDKGIEELAECVHPHPSITEGIQECVRMLLGKSLFKPDALKGRLSCRTYSAGEYADIRF